MKAIKELARKFILKFIFASSGRYQVELKKAGLEYLLLKGVDGGYLLCQEWNGIRYGEEVTIAISELDNLSVEITYYDEKNNEAKTVYKSLLAFVLGYLKNSIRNLHKLLAKLNLAKFKKLFLIDSDVALIKNIISKITGKKFAPDAYRLKYDVLKKMVELSLDSAEHKVSAESLIDALGEVNPSLVESVIGFLAETEDIKIDSYRGRVYKVNGKALETIDSMYRSNQMHSISFLLKIITVISVIIIFNIN